MAASKLAILSNWNCAFKSSPESVIHAGRPSGSSPARRQVNPSLVRTRCASIVVNDWRSHSVTHANTCFGGKCQRSRNPPGLLGCRSRGSPPRRSRSSPWGRRAWRTGCGPPTESGSFLPNEVRQEPNGEEDVCDDRSGRDYVHWYAGRSQAQIADSLGLDRKTVRKYLGRVTVARLVPGGPPVMTKSAVAGQGRAVVPGGGR